MSARDPTTGIAKRQTEGRQESNAGFETLRDSGATLRA